MRRATTALACSLFAASSTAIAGQVMLRMEGTITSGLFPAGPFSGATVGDTIIFEYIFDMATPDIAPAADEELYPNQSAAFTITVGSNTYSDFAHPSYGSGMAIYHDDDWLGDGNPDDVVLVSVVFPGSSSAFSSEFLSILLIDADATAMDGYAFPNAIPDMSQFEYAFGGFSYENHYDDPRFVVTSLTLTPVGIPLPSAGALALAGLTSLAGRRRRALALKGANR